MLIRKRKAQSITEYAIFSTVVIAGLIGLQIYFQRGVQGNIKERSDRVGDQFTLYPGNDFTYRTESQAVRESESGYKVDTDAGTVWSKSKITDTNFAPAALTELDTYAGFQYTSNYYTDGGVGGAAATKSEANFGDVNVTPWAEAGIE